MGTAEAVIIRSSSGCQWEAWIWFMKVSKKKKKRGHTTEWKAHNKIQRKREAQCEWHWKRAGPDTEQPEEERLPQRHRAGPTRGSEKWKKRKKKKKEKKKTTDGTSVSESHRNFICSGLNRVLKCSPRGLLLHFCSFVNPTVRLLQENFNHKARRHAGNGLPSLTECRSPSCSLSAELQASGRRPCLSPAGCRSALKADGEPQSRHLQTTEQNIVINRWHLPTGLSNSVHVSFSHQRPFPMQINV